MPKVLYVKKEQDGGEEYYVAGESLADLCLSVDDEFDVGVYHLGEILSVKAVITAKSKS